jgi:hypothetical protein
MKADLLAIGPYSEAVRENLAFPDYYYQGVPDGTLMVSPVIYCIGSEAVESLAEVLGFAMWDFSKHDVGNLSLEQYAGIRAWLKTCCFQEDIWSDVKVLRNAGFRFVFMLHA